LVESTPIAYGNPHCSLLAQLKCPASRIAPLLASVEIRRTEWRLTEAGGGLLNANSASGRPPEFVKPRKLVATVGAVTLRGKHQTPRRQTNSTNKRIKMCFFIAKASGLTTQAQRPGTRDATIANHGVMPGSLQRMVRRHGLSCHKTEISHDPPNRCETKRQYHER
jgi:hypothetical protein